MMINVRFDHIEVQDFYFSSDVNMYMAMYRMRTISCPFIRCRFFSASYNSCLCCLL